MKVSDYHFVIALDVYSFEELVNNYIKDDYQPLGTPQITCGPMGKGGYNVYYYQAMVKYEED